MIVRTVLLPCLAAAALAALYAPGCTPAADSPPVNTALPPPAGALLTPPAAPPPPPTEAVLTPVTAVPPPAFDAGRPAIGIARVAVSGDGRALRVAVTATEDAPAFLKRSKYGANPVELFLDTDHNPATGGAEWANPIAPGFEYRVTVKAGNVFREKDGQLSVGFGGGPTNVEIAGHVMGCNIERHLDGKAPEKRKGGTVIGGLSADLKARSRVEGREMALTIPYADLDLRPGQVVRVTARRVLAGGGLRDQFLSSAVLLLK